MGQMRKQAMTMVLSAVGGICFTLPVAAKSVEPNRSQILPQTLQQSIQQTQSRLVLDTMNAVQLTNAVQLAQAPNVEQLAEQIRTLRSAALKAQGAGKFTEAIDLHQQILQIFQRYNYQPGMAQTQWTIGTLYHELKNYPQALTVLQAAAQTVNPSENPELRRQIATSQRLAHVEIGAQQQRDRQYTAALASFEQARTIAAQYADQDGQVLALMKMAEVHRTQQFYRQAIPPLEAAQRIVQQQAEPYSQNVVLMMLGRTYDDLSEYPQALQYYEQALALAKSQQDIVQVASVVNNIGTIYLNQGNYTQGQEHFMRSLKAVQAKRQRYSQRVTPTNLPEYCQEAQSSSDPPLILLKQFCDSQIPPAFLAQKADEVFRHYWRMLVTLEGNLLNNLGSASSSLGNYAQAMDYHQQSLQAHKPLNNPGLDSTGWNNIGNVYLSQGNYLQALTAYEQSLKLTRQAENRDQEASTLNNMAQVYQAQGQVQRSIDVGQQALAIVRAIEDKHQEATILNNLGTSYVALAQYDQAQQVIDQALQQYRRVGDLAGEATVLNNLAILKGQRGDYAEAIRLHEASLKIAQRIGDRQKEAANLGNLGRAYADLAQYAKGIDYYNQALAIHQTLGNQSWVLSTQGNIAGMYRTLGQADKSLSLYQTVAQAAAALGESTTTGIGLVGSATIWLQQGDLQAAETALNQALKLHREAGAKRSEIYALRQLADLQSQQGKLDRAIATLAQTRELAKSVGPLESSLVLQDLAQRQLDRAQYAAAQTTANQAIALAKPAQYQDIVGKSLTILGQARLASNQATTAVQPLAEAIDLWESLRPGLKDSDKVSLFDTQAQTYRLLQKALAIQGQTDRALEVAERGRARAFVELFAAKTGQAQTQLEIPDLTAIKALAKQQQSTLVEYSQIDDRTLYIWVVKPNGDVIFRESQLPDGSLAQMVALSRSEIGVRSRASIAQVDLTQVSTVRSPSVAQNNFQALYQLLIQPIAADLPPDAHQKVVFMPQGALFYVPFAALADAQGKLLLEKHTIAIAPSMQSLDLTAKLKQRTPQQGATLIVGNPTMPTLDGLALTPLPGAEQEAKAVGNLLKTSPLLGGDATKSTVVKQMQQARIVHLATHGLLDTFRGDVPGAIVLAGGKTTADSLLTSSEIADLNLQAELVVLSACSTGKGDITGDGVIGLSRSLFLAGVPSVVVSLWDVDDAATSTLMTAFYRHWQSGQMDKAQALRQAMLETRKTYRDPHLWAAFNLVGAS